MNLRAIKERCERYKWFENAAPEQTRGMDKDEFYMPLEEYRLMTSAIEEDVPALLEWVERIKAEVIQMCEDAQMEGAFSEACVRAQELLAELEE